LTLWASKTSSPSKASLVGLVRIMGISLFGAGIPFPTFTRVFSPRPLRLTPSPPFSDSVDRFFFPDLRPQQFRRSPSSGGEPSFCSVPPQLAAIFPFWRLEGIPALPLSSCSRLQPFPQPSPRLFFFFQGPPSSIVLDRSPPCPSSPELLFTPRLRLNRYSAPGFRLFSLDRTALFFPFFVRWSDRRFSPVFLPSL